MRMLCLPRIISNESAMVKTLVPPWKGAKPRSPSDQYGPPTLVVVNPQLTQSVVDWDRPAAAPPGKPEQLLSKSAPGMPSLAASHERAPNDRVGVNMR